MKNDLNEWGVNTEPVADEKRVVTIDELDNAVKAVASARKDYEDKKKISDEASRQVDVAETNLMDLLQAAGKTSYKLDGVASISLYDKFEVKNPSDPEERQKFFDWVEGEYGQAGLDKYRVTNYMAINALYNEWQSACETNGKDPEIPGLGMATARKVLRVTKAK